MSRECNLRISTPDDSRKTNDTTIRCDTFDFGQQRTVSIISKIALIMGKTKKNHTVLLQYVQH